MINKKHTLKKKLENFIINKNTPNVNTKYDRHNIEYSDRIEIRNDIIDISAGIDNHQNYTVNNIKSC